MNKILLIVGILLIIFAAIIFWGTNKMVAIHKADIAKADRKIDSLTRHLNATEATTALLKQTATHERKNYLRADSMTQVVKYKLASQTAYYHQKIQSIKELTDEKLDSAVTALYPESLRPSFNQHIRPISIPNWRLTALVQDRLRLDSAYAVIGNKDSVIVSQQLSLDTRGKFIATQDKIIADDESAISDLKGISITKDTKIQLYKDDAKQYRKQRNIVGGVAAILLILALVH